MKASTTPAVVASASAPVPPMNEIARFWLVAVASYLIGATLVPARTSRSFATIAVPSLTNARVTPWTEASGSMMLSVNPPPETESAVAVAVILAMACTRTEPVPTSMSGRSLPPVPTAGPICASTLALDRIFASAFAPAAAISPIVTGMASASAL